MSKSPVPLFDPQPFNVFSPWKYESNLYTGALYNRPANMVKNSPIKSPSKLCFGAGKQWPAFSPIIDSDKENFQGVPHFKSFLEFC